MCISLWFELGLLVARTVMFLHLGEVRVEVPFGRFLPYDFFEGQGLAKLLDPGVPVREGIWTGLKWPPQVHSWQDFLLIDCVLFPLPLFPPI